MKNIILIFIGIILFQNNTMCVAQYGFLNSDIQLTLNISPQQDSIVEISYQIENNNDSKIYVRPWINDSDMKKYIINSKNMKTLYLQLGYKSSIQIPSNTLKSVLEINTKDSISYTFKVDKTILENKERIVINFDYVAYNSLSEKEILDFNLISQTEFFPNSPSNLYKYPNYNKHCKWFEIKMPLANF